MMRIEQQEAGTTFNYQSLKSRLIDTPMSPAQLGAVNQRIDMLESFMPKAQTAVERRTCRKEVSNWGIVHSPKANNPVSAIHIRKCEERLAKVCFGTR
jgi:hypothetical protein